MPILWNYLALLVCLDTQQVQSGIDAQSRLKKPFVLPAGIHTVGTLRLPSNSHLRFAPGAVLRMLKLNADYAPPERLGFEPFADLETSRFEHALLFGSDADNITIDGPGRIECERTQRGGPKPISLRRCTKIKLDGFTIDQAPNYAVSLIGCERVDIGNLKITRAHADGIDLDCTRDARIHDCDVESFDDAICLKTSASLQRKLPTSNVTVENCRLRTGSVFFKLGTESYGDFSGIRVRNVTMTGGMGNRHGNPGIALETVDGGNIRNVEIRGVKMDRVGTPIFLRIGERKNAPSSPGAGEMDGIRLIDIEARGTRYASVIAGLNDAPIRNLRLANIAVEPVGGEGMFDAKQRVPEARNAYPEPIQFGPIPASAFYIRHVQGLRLEGLKYLLPAASPALILERVSGDWPGCSPAGQDRLVCGGSNPGRKLDAGARPQGTRLP